MVSVFAAPSWSFGREVVTATLQSRQKGAMMRTLATALLASAALAIAAGASAADDEAQCFSNNDAVLPSGSPEAPGDGVPAPVARWVGAYEGAMDMRSSSGGGDWWCKKLLVRAVDADGTWEGVYSAGSWGRIDSYQVNLRRESISDDGVLTYSLSNGIRFVYTLDASGDVATGTVHGNRGSYPAKLRRITR